MLALSIVLALCASAVSAFPWVANIPGVDLSALHGRVQSPHFKRQSLVDKGGPEFCPATTGIRGAAPFNPLFPYTGAVNGLPGTGIGGIRVPAPGDTAHEFVPPGPNDIRGPCPGMNTAANHNFLSHDGITNLVELLDAQQNLYNLRWELALIIAARAIPLDGDIATTRLSIGCDATSRTSVDPEGTLGRQPGLDGHNRFETDTSLTRDDFFFYGDDFTFNSTLFQTFYEFAQTYGGGLFNRSTIAAYRSKRYDDSLGTNPNFYFGPKAILLYSAASFIYEAFPGSSNEPDLATISSFFGAQDNGDGTWTSIPERIPDNWSNRATAYGIPEIGQETYEMYSAYPKLFGGNVGTNNFVALNTTFGIIENGQIPDDATAADFTCFLYQLLSENVPGQVENEPQLGFEALAFILGNINPVFAGLGCPISPNPTRK